MICLIYNRNIKTFTPWEQPRFDTFRGWWNNSTEMLTYQTIEYI